MPLVYTKRSPALLVSNFSPIFSLNFSSFFSSKRLDSSPSNALRLKRLAGQLELMLKLRETVHGLSERRRACQMSWPLVLAASVQMDALQLLQARQRQHSSGRLLARQKDLVYRRKDQFG